MAQLSDLKREQSRPALEAALSLLQRSQSRLDQQFKLWETLIRGDEADVSARLSDWEEIETWRIEECRQLQKTLDYDEKLSGGSQAQAEYFLCPSQIRKEFVKKKQQEEKLAKASNFALFFKKPADYSLSCNPIIKDKDFKQILKKMLDADQYLILYPKDIAGESHKVVTVIYLPTLTVINMYFDVITKEDNVRTLVMYDIAFHLLLEDICSTSNTKYLDLNVLKNDYHMELNKQTTMKALYVPVKGYGRWPMDFKKNSSDHKLYIDMAKIIRLKCKKYSLTDVRRVMAKLLEVIQRYMLFLTQMECSQCRQVLKLDPQKGIVEFPLLNYSMKFYHSACCPEEFIDTIV